MDGRRAEEGGPVVAAAVRAVLVERAAEAEWEAAAAWMGAPEASCDETLN